MPHTIRDILNWTNNEHVLLRYPDGEPALWLRDEGAGFTINDIGLGYSVEPDEDLDEIIREWKTNVDWTDEPREEEDDGTE